MIIPTPRTWANTDATDYTMMNTMYDDQVFLLGTPSSSVFRSASTTCPSNSRVQLSMTGSYYDNDVMWDSTQPKRLTVVTPGLYDVGMSLLWGANSSNGPRMVGWVGISKNSADTWPGDTSNNYLASDVKAVGAHTFSAFPTCNTITTSARFVANDYIQFWCKCIRDKTWTIPAGANSRFACAVMLKWVSP